MISGGLLMLLCAAALLAPWGDDDGPEPWAQLIAWGMAALGVYLIAAAVVQRPA